MGEAWSDTASECTIPYLESVADGHQLVVHDEPFLILGAEIHNSSLSCPQYMSATWPKLKESNVNTVLANVTWEAIEPQRGQFHFDHVTTAIKEARQYGLKLILLWFGAFKNGKSTYAPSWVKTDPASFPRAVLRERGGRRVVADMLSMFGSEVVDADASAFAALMRHIKIIDAQYSTVVMVQVENEVGVLGDSRDASPGADTSFNRSVPNELHAMLSRTWDELHPSLRRNFQHFTPHTQHDANSTWPQTFGDSCWTDELFMAYHYALYVEHVTRAGKKEYPLPMFTNVWQNYADEDTDKSQPVTVGGGGQPGDYPSGGAVINVLDIWQSFAPSLDFVAPDLYLNDYNAVCAKYRHRGQALFIPEQRRDEYGARRVWSAYGSYGALCASPFAIDTLSQEDNPWVKHYRLLSQISAYILAARKKVQCSFGFFFDEFPDEQPATAQSETFRVQFEDWELVIERAFVFGRPGPGFGMVIHLGGSRFMLVGEGFQVTFRSTQADAVFTGILSFVEKIYDSSTRDLRDGRMLNGDETRSGECAVMPSQDPDLGDFPICITIPARTSIAQCEVYALFSGSVSPT